jgi:hypothetical protein
MSRPAVTFPLDPAQRATVARWTFALVAAVLLPMMIVASEDFGATWDEKSRHRYGENILEYFQGLRTRESFDVDGGSPYGGLFDVLCAAVERWVPIERYTLRHGLNAAFGWIGVLCSGLLAARLFGTWAGVIAMILLASSPRYFGDSMNNPKDLPFAALTVAALYQFTRLSASWPYFSWGTAARVALVLGLALNIRAGALLYLGYFGLLVAGAMLVEALSTRRVMWSRVVSTVARVGAVALVTMLVGTIFWPWAQGAPLVRPVQALIGFANFDWGGNVVFRGRNFDATSLPWQYAPEWFLISTPPVVLVGAAASLALLARRDWRLPVALLWGAAALPVAMVIARRSTLYDGIRHLLFVVPLLVVLAAAAWAHALQQPRRWLRIAGAAGLTAGVVNVMAFNVRAHPNQIVYFNELVGGPRGAMGRYDLDYWGNCLLQAVDWTAAAARTARRPVTVSGNPWPLVQLDVERVKELYFIPPHRSYEIDIRLNRGSSEGVLDLAARDDALYRVETPDGAVLCAVLRGPLFHQLEPHLQSMPASSHAAR